jgi:hypothetical protein
MPNTAAVRDKAVERIRKLMAVSSGAGATEAEIETYLAAARKLMDKFAVEESELNRNEDTRQAAYESMVIFEAYARAGGISPWDNWLAYVPDAICDVGHYTSKKWRANKRGKFCEHEVLIFYGLPRDCEVAKAMYQELLATMRAMARFRLGKDWMKLEQDYCTGFTTRLTTRARELKRSSSSPENAEGSGSTAIVLLKDQLLKRKREELGLVARKGRSSSRSINEGAYSAGAEDGGNVSLGTNQIGASRKAIE